MSVISVICAFAPTPSTQLYQTLKVNAGSTVADVIALTGWQAHYPDLQPDSSAYSVGIFSQKVDWQTLVKQGDRIELYRPLVLDPIARRERKRTAKKA